jgi:hypothetical protein
MLRRSVVAVDNDLTRLIVLHLSRTAENTHVFYCNQIAGCDCSFFCHQRVQYLGELRCSSTQI